MLDEEALPGYLDDSRALASSTSDDGPRSLWLLDVATERSPRGPIRYGEHDPAGVDQIRPLGDGTWLTVDGATLRRWTLD